MTGILRLSIKYSYYKLLKHLVRASSSFLFVKYNLFWKITSTQQLRNLLLLMVHCNLRQVLVIYVFFVMLTTLLVLTHVILELVSGIISIGKTTFWEHCMTDVFLLPIMLSHTSSNIVIGLSYILVSRVE